MFQLTDEQFLALLTKITRKFNEDIAQETVARMLASPTEIEHPFAYSFIVAHHVANDWNRGRQNVQWKRFEPLDIQGAEDGEQVKAAVTQPAQEAYEFLGRVIHAAHKLGASVLRDILANVEDYQGTPQETVRTRRRRARRRLARAVGESIPLPKGSKGAVRASKGALVNGGRSPGGDQAEGTRSLKS